MSGAEDSIPVSALEAAAEYRRLVLTGKTGSGKTTFGRYLCLCFAAPKEILRVSRGGAFEFGADGVRCPVHRRKGIQA